MNRVVWMLRRWRHSCGWLGAAGLALAMGCVVAVATHIRPERTAQTAALQQETQHVARLAHELATRVKPARQHTLPDASTYTEFLRAHAALATARSIALTEIDYTSRAEAGQRLLRHTMRYTVEGRYPELRDYLATLEEIAGVRVESISFMRQSDASRTVNALVQLSYLVETGP
ncbi:hypothetical protein SAMN04488595_12613 [Ralstonia sp. 25mfcol4.1]|uniref:hypothetical protein n=1 Tax=Burkholderiaceae TaxID=119060 RepID=UPI00088A67F2|nr:hypothetical protein [Ralstonia sp. 25mfcol4.1]SDP80419.1 hypothetical protein SAMN04488595_12613 [Ralstonia sp. 25mfcol4.1]